MTAKQQALQDLEAARGALAHHASLAAKEWSPRAVITHSIQQHRVVWITGAAVAGLLAVRLIFSGGSNNRRDNFEPSAKKSGLLALLLTPLLAYGRKAALQHGVRLFQSYLQHRISPNVPPQDRV